MPSPVSNHDGGCNSRSREGSDDTSQDDKEHIVVVSIHAPARGATPLEGGLPALRATFQFTLPRGERRRHAHDGGVYDDVSIHAPARGATGASSPANRTMPVSIHAPARGATVDTSARDGVRRVVSIHAPARGATALTRRVGRAREVSIHAPARGATTDWQRSRYSSSCFNSRSREGSDHIGVREIDAIGMFQFTLPRGERPRDIELEEYHVAFQFTLPRGERLLSDGAVAYDQRFNSRSREGSDTPGRVYTALAISFNSRSREGSDDLLDVVTEDNAVSIHAPARGATFSEASHLPRRAVSIHAPARGATRQMQTSRMKSFGFNSRSREGSDRWRGGCLWCPRCFNSRSREGSDLTRATLILSADVSIHAPARGAT